MIPLGVVFLSVFCAINAPSSVHTLLVLLRTAIFDLVPLPCDEGADLFACFAAAYHTACRPLSRNAVRKKMTEEPSPVTNLQSRTVTKLFCGAWRLFSECRPGVRGLFTWREKCNTLERNKDGFCGRTRRFWTLTLLRRGLQRSSGPWQKGADPVRVGSRTVCLWRDCYAKLLQRL